MLEREIPRLRDQLEEYEGLYAILRVKEKEYARR